MLTLGLLSNFASCVGYPPGNAATLVGNADVSDVAQCADRSTRYGPISREVSGIGSAPRLLGGLAMRLLAWCALTLCLMGCHSGPRWSMRDYHTEGPADFEDSPGLESTPQPSTPQLEQPVPLPPQPVKEGPTLTPPVQPAQKSRTPYESSSRPRSVFGSRSTSQASRAKNSSSSRTTMAARRGATSAPVAKATALDESLKQLMADLERTKREKSALETRLAEESAKQTQQRLEVEARLALLQEQMRQQSALQQVAYQQQAAAMSRTQPGYAGPAITSGTPSPSMQMPFSSSTPMFAPTASSQPVPAWGNSAPTWNSQAVPPQQPVEQWPFSPQRR